MLVFVQPTPESCEQIRQQGFDPAWACVCQVVHFPAGMEPTDNCLQAAWFAAKTPVGHTLVVDPKGGPDKRAPVVDRLQSTQDGKPVTIRFLVGFAKPGTATP
jgi:hypothetical protein